MKYLFRFLLVASLIANLAVPTMAASPADTFPSGPINLVVAFSAGAATDVQARFTAMVAHDKQYFGQPVVVLNKPGAGGTTGWNWVIDRGTRDGLTMTAYNLPHILAQSMISNTKFNAESFEPLGNYARDPCALVVSNASPFHSLNDIVEFAKKNPKKFTSNGAGLYIGHHICSLQFAKSAGIEITYIPEKSGTDGMQSVLAGKVMATFANSADAYRMRDNFRVLAVADLERQPFLPDVPTFQELGFKEVDNTSVVYRGYALPTGTDPAIVEKAAEISYRMFQDPRVIEKFEQTGSVRALMTREESKELWKKLDSNLRVILADYIEGKK